MLLPLAAEPLAAPTDRDMLPSERREFVRTHRTCVFGYARRTDGPSMSIVYYIPTDDDELLVSTMGGRSKAKAVVRSGKVSLCILDERWPFAYVQVYCDARVETDPDLVVDVMMAVAGRMSGQPLPGEARPAVEWMAKDEGQVEVLPHLNLGLVGARGDGPFDRTLRNHGSLLAATPAEGEEEHDKAFHRRRRLDRIWKKRNKGRS